VSEASAIEQLPPVVKTFLLDGKRCKIACGFDKHQRRPAKLHARN
jgi:hypothetical protein